MPLQKQKHTHDGVMVNMLASSASDHEFEHWSGHTTEYDIGICCFSIKHAAFRSKSKLFGSQSGKCVQVEQHVYPLTIVSMN